jgi:hypothetical protein
VRVAKTLLIALAASATLPVAANARTGTMYHVVHASGTQTVSFSADPRTCARMLTCGYAGTVTYRFGGTPSGRLVITRDRRGRLNGLADFNSRGTTAARITRGTACNDTVSHGKEHFSLTSRSRLGSLLFEFHGGRTDHIVTDCPGPTEADLAHDRALPEGSFRQKDFKGFSTKFNLKGSSVFRESGYRGSAAWNLTYRLERYRCSPNCKVR